MTKRLRIKDKVLRNKIGNMGRKRAKEDFFELLQRALHTTPRRTN